MVSIRESYRLFNGSVNINESHQLYTHTSSIISLFTPPHNTPT